MRFLQKEGGLFTQIPEATNGQYRISFGSLMIEQLGCTPVVDDLHVLRFRVMFAQCVKHPLRGSYHNIRSANALRDETLIPFQPPVVVGKGAVYCDPPAQ